MHVICSRAPQEDSSRSRDTLLVVIIKNCVRPLEKSEFYNIPYLFEIGDRCVDLGIIE